MNSVAKSPLQAFEAKLRRFLRIVMFENLGFSLGVSFGISQALLAYWWLAVVLREPPPTVGRFLVAVAVLVAFNLGVVFTFGTVRSRRMRARNVASVYSAIGFSLTVIAAVVVFGGFGFVGMAAILGLAGGGPQTAFEAFRWASGSMVAATGFALLSGFTGGRRTTRVHPVTVRVRGLPDGADGLRIAHLSDLHIGNGIEGKRLERIVSQTNALGADIVVITGDIFDRDRAAIPEGARGLAGLRARLGVFAVLGNHDDYTGFEAVCDGLAAHAPSIRVLRGERTALPVDGGRVYLAGLDDPGRDWSIAGPRTAALERLALDLPDDGPTLLLVHRPDAFPRAADLGFPLVLAGHYHGGQIAVPGSSGRLNPARLLTEFDGGVYRRDDATLFVSKGIGTTGPRIRLACPPEIGVIELRR
jgi:predicted MPP superfamily phosphohydrolase